MNIKDKVFVVTGGGNGIGRQVVLQLLNKDAIVVAVDISESALNSTAELAGDKAKNLLTQPLDITNKDAIEALAQNVISKYGNVHGVMNVAGIIQPFIKVLDLDYKSIQRVMDVNFYGTLYMSKTFLPYLLKNDCVSYICNVSSMGAFLPVPGQSVYGASKAAVQLLTEGLYAELLKTNVSATTVLCGAVATEITKNSNVEVKMVATDDNKKQKSFKMTTPEKAAEIIIDGTLKQKFRVMVGKDSKFLNFINRVNPKKSVHFITKQMKNLLN